MAFQGDAAQIPLSNILQALLLNNQEGVLTLEADSLRQRVRILRQGLRPLSYSADGSDLLKHVLLKLRVLTESQFQNALSTWTPGSSCPGDFLIARGILTREGVAGDVRHQLENLLLELVVTPGLKYEFTAEADGSPYEVFSPGDLGQQLVFNANAILMEALRREDEMARIRAEIPSPDEVFVATDRTRLSSKSLEVDPRCLAALKPLLDGEHTIGKMVALTPLCSFEVHQAIFKLKQQRLVRALLLDEKKALAEKLRKSLRSDDALDMFRSILLADPGDDATRLKLVALLEKKKDCQAELASHYFRLASDAQTGDRAQSKAYLQKSLELAPDNVAALEMLFDACRDEGNHRDALAVARSAIACARKDPKAAEPLDLLYKIINFYPEEPGLFHEIAEIHIAAGNADAAADCLKMAADLYERRGDVHKLRKTLEQIAKIQPEESSWLRRVSDLERRARQSSSSLFRLAAITTFGAACLTGLAFIGVTEYESRVAFASILRDVETHKRVGDLGGARVILEEFERTFPLSTRMKAAQDQLRELHHLAILRREEAVANLEKRRMVASSAYTKVRLALDSNDLEKAHDLLSGLDLDALPVAQADEAKAQREWIARHFGEAKALLALAEAAERNGDMAACYRHRREVVRKYPHAPAAQGVALPILVETVPPGAEVIVEDEPFGRTPAIVKLPPQRLPRIVLARKGYKDFRLTRDPVDGAYFDPLEGHQVVVRLEKSVVWRVAAGAPTEGFPAATADSVFFATRHGKVLSVHQDTGEVIWVFTVPQNMDCAGGIGLWNGLLYFGSFDGRLYVLDSLSGKLAHEPFLASPERHPIKHAPSLPSERGLVAVNCDRKAISTLNLGSGRPGWTLNAGGAHFLGQPQAHKGKLYLCTAAGDVLLVDHDTGSVLKRMSLGVDLAARGRVSADGHYLVGTPQGKLLCLSPADQRVLWSFDCGEPVSSPPTVEGDLVLVPTTARGLHCLSVTGEHRWTLRLPDIIHEETDGVVSQGSFLIGTRRGVILCVDVGSGKLTWEFKTAGALDKQPRGILSAPAVSRGKVFFGSEDHQIYCFSVD
ncbi:MAG: PQQ-binding-like beta-propeller repeat protein [Planctomycetes bacterium]|nr:PQQ-binding-like beta-propeller repeat protein [Planctomycetota bacterium]